MDSHTFFEGRLLGHLLQNTKEIKVHRYALFEEKDEEVFVYTPLQTQCACYFFKIKCASERVHDACKLLDDFEHSTV